MVKKTSVTIFVLAAILAVFLPSASAYQAAMNCGGPAYTASDGTVYIVDQEYSSTNGAGYSNGYGASTAEPIQSTQDSFLYQSNRWGLSEYKFDLPNGFYNVKLQFAEIWFGGSGGGGIGSRVFDVCIEDKTILRSLDIYALVGYAYALDYEFTTEVTDGQLNIKFFPVTDQPTISAISVKTAVADSTPPAAPTDLSAVSADTVVFLDWTDNSETDLRGYNVYRSDQSGGPYLKLNSDIVIPSKYKDAAVINGQNYYYIVKAVDYFNNESEGSSEISASPAAITRNFLPIPSCAWQRYIGDIPYKTASSSPNRGVALGGFGAGSFMYNISGLFGPWNMDISKWGFKKDYLTVAALHIYEKRASSASLTKCLSTEESIKPAWDKIKVGQAQYFALQPKGWTTYNSFSTDVSSEFFSPIIANNYKETSYPVAVWQWKISNPTAENVEVAVMLTWPNVEGKYLNNTRTGFQTQLKTLGDITGVVLKANSIDNPSETQNSEWCIAAKQDVSTTLSYVTSWNAAADGLDVWNDFADDGRLSNAGLDSSYSAAAIAIKTVLAPGESKTIPFVISWDFPVVEFGSGTQWWRKYTEYFGTDSNNSFDIAVEALNNYQSWEAKIDDWMNPFVNNPKYPDWLKTAAFNELYYNQFGGVFYESGLKAGHAEEFMGLHPEDHKHFVMESQRYGSANSIDVRYYSSIIYAKLWPEIEKDTLKTFADAILYYNFNPPVPLGVIPHDVGDPDSWDPYFEFDVYRHVIPDMPYWKDTPSMFIQQVWRYYYIYQDRTFIDYVWPAVKAAYGFMKTTDTNGDYLPNNAGADSTYDLWGLYGTSLFCGGLWIGALEAVERMAIIESDPILTEAQTWLTNAKVNLDNQLWDTTGGYYRLDTESSLHGGTSNALMSGGIAGQRYCEKYGLTDILPKDRMLSHLQKTYGLCVVPLFDYNLDGIGDCGAVNGRKEDGSKLDGIQQNEVWGGITYFLAASMHHAGLQEAALKTAFGIYYLIYQEESAAYWFNTPEAWDESGKNPRPSNPEQYERPRAVWELIFEIDDPIVPVIPPGQKLAVSSSVEQNDPQYNADKAIDGSLTTRWSSAFSDPQWIYIDLGQQKQINKVVLNWETAYGKTYKIQVSNDAISWTDVFSTNNSDGGIDEIFFTAVTTRYVRMYGTQRATQWGYSLYEFDATYQDVPPPPTATASSVESLNYSADKAIDGSLTTRWSSAFSDPQWIYIDFKMPKTFNTVTLNWEAAYAREYQIQISDDAVNWTAVYTETNGNGATDTISVGTRTARYVRIYGTRRATRWGYSLWEFGVY